MGAAGRAAQDCEWYGTNVSMIDGWAATDCEWLYECLHDWFLEPKHDNTCIRWLLVRNSNYHVFAILYLVFLKAFLPCWLQQVLLVDLWLLIHLNYLFGTTNPIMSYSTVVNSLKVNFIEWRKISVILSLIIIWMNVAVVFFLWPNRVISMLDEAVRQGTEILKFSQKSPLFKLKIHLFPPKSVYVGVRNPST